MFVVFELLRGDASELVTVFPSFEIMLKLRLLLFVHLLEAMLRRLTQVWILSSARAKVVKVQAARKLQNNNRSGRSTWSLDWSCSCSSLMN
jgi:hypothetical protein